MKNTIIMRFMIILVAVIMALTFAACELDDFESDPVTLLDEDESDAIEPEKSELDKNEPEINEPDTDGHLPPSIFPFSFTAADLYGNTVTEDTLGEKRLFFVHLWATWCPPCIAEMPDLSEVVLMFEDEVGFIGLLVDFSTNSSIALEIKEASGTPASFVNIDVDTPELA